MARRGDAGATALAPILQRGDLAAGGLSETGGVAGASGQREEEAGGDGRGGCETCSWAGRPGRGCQSGGAAPTAGHPLCARFGHRPVLNRNSHCLRVPKGGSHAWKSYRKEQREKKTHDNTRVSHVRNGTAIMEHLNDQVYQEKPLIKAEDARKRSSSTPRPPVCDPIQRTTKKHRLHRARPGL